MTADRLQPYVTLGATRRARPGRPRFSRWAVAVLGVLPCAGCHFELDVSAPSAPPLEQDVDAPIPVFHGFELDAGSGREGLDGGTADDLESMLLGAQHWSCSTPPPDALPPPPLVASDALGRPAFDRWRDLDCAALEPLRRCSLDVLDVSLLGCGECVFPVPGEPGYCMEEGWPGDAAPFFFRDLECAVQVSDLIRARACCAAPGQFDCRSWPYPGDSKVGQACSVHEDCEPGLVCKQTESSYGACTCPEETPRPPTPAADCSEFVILN